MEMNAIERSNVIAILNQCVKRNSVEILRQVQAARDECELTPEELQQCEMRENGQFNQAKAIALTKDINLGEWVTRILRLQLEMIDHLGILPPDCVTLHEKICKE